MCKPDCSCQKHGPHVNLRASDIRYETFNGRSHMVVPVVMAIENVVMNGALLPVEEMIPVTWNGVPVTVGHPALNSGQYVSANSPDVLESWAIGQIFNSKVEDGILRAEAWIDIDKAKRIDVSLLQLLKSSDIDVSTGYFSDHETSAGESNGRKYEVIHRHIRPDHLALLPNEEGACSWKDGCGVRTNRGMLMKAKDLLLSVAKSLGIKTEETDDGALRVHESSDLPAKEDETEEETMNAEAIQKAVNAALEASLPSIVEKAVTPAVNAAVDSAVKSHPAIIHANTAVDQHRSELVTRIINNSDMKEDQLTSLSVETLQAVANGLRQPTDMTGRAFHTNAPESDAAKEMGNVGVLSHLRKAS